MSERKSPIVINVLTRTIRFDNNGKMISDTITNHISGETYPTPKRKKRKKKCI